ncbi:MAG: hypothetical protein K5930_08490 [Treponemataceae bacterium]|nr:hypothetical protein [Treponemataceae bacterium]
MKEHLSCRTGHPLLPVFQKQIFAHRGYHDKPRIPENSIAAFKRAIERGWGMEFDVHLLKDASLMVFHDELLKRCTGAEGYLEDLTLDEAKTLRLEGSEEQIPSFDEVLELVDGKVPLIIELKSFRGNYKSLASAVMTRLDSYKGSFCIESFDPRCVLAVKKLRPDVMRGQLAQDFIKRPENLPSWQRGLLTRLSFGVLTKPDFIAYKYEDRNVKACRHTVDKKGAQEFSWTIASKADFDECKRCGSIPIFERFDPEK